MFARTPVVAGLAAAAMVGAGLGSTAAAQPARVVAAAAAQSFEGAQGTYVGVEPTRVLDTRTGNGAPKALVGAGGEVSLLVAGRAGVPGGVSAVVLNLAAVAPSTNTFLTAYPSGTTRPATSSLNVAARGNRANMVTVPVGADGRVRIYNSTGTTHILADVMGYYHGQVAPATGPGSTYIPLDPERVYDSRWPDGYMLGAGQGATAIMDFGPFAADIQKLAMNITVFDGTRPGYLSAGASFTHENPGFSTINYGQGQTIANMSVGISGSAGSEVWFSVKNGGPGGVRVIMDLVGLYTSGEEENLRFRPLAPRRIIDTRSGIGGPAKPLGANEARLHTAPESVATIDTWALAANTTIASPTTSTYVTVYDADLGKPAVSNLNAARGETSANSTFVPLSIDQQFGVHNAAGSAPVIMDVFGSFEYVWSEFAPEGARQSRSGPTAPALQGVRVEHG